jgi:hypothetical protein
MEDDLTGKDYQSLLNLYNQEIDSLKDRLLNGESWENLKDQRRNITQLAIALTKSHGHVFPAKMNLGNPAEFPQADKEFDYPVE